jgi:hypothetical protein
VPAAHRRCTTPLPASWTIPVGRGFKSDGGPPAGGARDRELAHRRESRLSHEVPLGWAGNRCRHRSRPSPKYAHERWKNPHNSSRARSNTSLVYTSRSAARSCYGVGRAYRCGTLSSPHAGEPRSLHVSSAPVGADRGPAAPRDDPRCDPPSHLVDHRERPAGRNRLRSARHREW